MHFRKRHLSKSRSLVMHLCKKEKLQRFVLYMGLEGSFFFFPPPICRWDCSQDAENHAMYHFCGLLHCIACWLQPAIDAEYAGPAKSPCSKAWVTAFIFPGSSDMSCLGGGCKTGLAAGKGWKVGDSKCSNVACYQVTSAVSSRWCHLLKGRMSVTRYSGVNFCGVETSGKVRHEPVMGHICGRFYTNATSRFFDSKWYV